MGPMSLLACSLRIFAVVLPLIVTASCAPSPDADKPNILFILVDDLGTEWISSYGAEDIQTPAIDRLAAGGMRFTNAYSMPQCTPTRATLLTGQYPFRHGWVNHWDVPRWGAGVHFDPKHNLTFARLLKKEGYATAIAGKWQINDFRVQPDVLRQHGFDEWCMWTGYETGNPPSGERYWDPYLFVRDPGTGESSSRTYEGRFGADIFVDYLIDFMKRRRDEPMLLYFPMALTHTPLVHTPKEPNASEPIDQHKAMVRYVDHLVDRLVSALDELGLREQTIIFLTTDNGTSRRIEGGINGRRVGGGKATLTENGTRMPFIVNGRGLVPEGVVSDALTDFSDILPTFVDLAGGELPKGEMFDGRSIAPVILGKDVKGARQWILAMGYGPARLDDQGVRPARNFADRVLRDKRYKLHVIDGKPAKLHDLRNDPWEETNLIGSEAAEHVAAREKLGSVLGQFPKQDGRPRYEPLPAQPWDLSREANERMWNRRARP
jgi:arylsulfatase A-like enzyme